MKARSEVFIGIGTNLGDRLANLRLARSYLLELPNCLSLSCSSLYLSSPVGGSEQPNYINAVARINYVDDAHQLLQELQNIERKMGRVRDPKDQNAARLIDLDVLLFEQKVINSTDLLVPHPRILERLFVIFPLLELAPNLVMPSGEALASVYQQAVNASAFEQQKIHKLT